MPVAGNTCLTEQRRRGKSSPTRSPSRKPRHGRHQRTYFRVQMGSDSGDHSGVNVGQLEGAAGGDTTFNSNVMGTKAGLYPPDLIFETAGNDRTYCGNGNTASRCQGSGQRSRNGGIKSLSGGLTHTGRWPIAEGWFRATASQCVPMLAFTLNWLDGRSALKETWGGFRSVRRCSVYPRRPQINKVGNVTLRRISAARAVNPRGPHGRVGLHEGAGSVTRSWRVTVGKYVTLDPASRVAGVDITKTGFNWKFLPMPTRGTWPTP